ncbi:helix-turn-helix transcriptional regulator [Ensifer aridi]|uniref:helix-turn-helix transcriptional regulator n=1 Tax=Ensifer aridi TaxID=1708715 RepID=UPI001FD91496|nr:AlpA family transcriptional regulator [Ensifer aridi]
MAAGYCGEKYVEDFLDRVGTTYPQPRVVESVQRKFWYRDDLDRAIDVQAISGLPGQGSPCTVPISLETSRIRRMSAINSAERRETDETPLAAARGSILDGVDVDRFLKLKEVVAITSVGTSTIYRWMKAGRFPKPRQFGLNCVRWRESEIQEWMDALPTSGEVTGP